MKKYIFLLIITIFIIAGCKSEQEKLAEIINIEKRANSVLKLENQKILSDVAKYEKNQKVRYIAVYKLNDQNVLHWVTKHDKNWEIRRIAVENKFFFDQKLLMNIAKKDEEFRVRTSAVKKIKNQKHLTYIYINDSSFWVRKTAVENVYFKNENVLINIINDHKEHIEVKKAAASNINIKNQERLAIIAKNNQSWEVRYAVVKNKNFKDQTLLLDIAKNDKTDGVRHLAVQKLKDQKVLAKFALNVSEKNLRLTAIKNKNLTNQCFLINIAISDKEILDIRKAAIKKITIQNVLIYISQTDKSSVIRETAVNNKYFTDQKHLAIIANNDQSIGIRVKAITKINNINFLREIIKNSNDIGVQRVVIRRIKYLILFSLFEIHKSLI